MSDNFQNNIFTQEWWWDAVCPPENRHEIEFRNEKGECRGLWRMAKNRRLGIFHVYGMPPLTQHAGPWISDRQDFSSLIACIPAQKQLCLNVGFRLTDQEIRIAQTQGIQVMSRVSHRLKDLSDLEKVYHGLKPPRQRQIRKAERQLSALQIDEIEPLIEMQEETFRRRNMKNPYPPQTVRRLYRAVKEHHAGNLIALIDRQDRIMACGLFVHDDKVCYSLTHGFHKLGQDLGAGSLLQWKGIEYAALNGWIFDFEGSNIESIAKFNSSFGAIPEAYSRLERYNTVFRFGERLWHLLK